MKSIWLINHDALSPGNAGGTRHYTLAKYLAPLGWQATVIAGSVEYNSFRQRLEPHETTRLETLEGVPFLWLKVPIYCGNKLDRLWNMLAFARRLLQRKTTQNLPRPQMIVGSSPQPFAALAAYFLAKRYKAAFCYEIRDLWPAGLVELGRISARHPLMMLFGWIEKFLARRADRVITLLPGVKHYLMPLGVREERIVWIPNGVDVELFSSTPPAPERTPFTFMYFGAHGTANGLDNLLRAMKHLQQEAGAPAIGLRLIGEGPAKKNLVALAEELAVQHVSFEPPVPKQSIPALAAQADAFVFNLTDAPVFTKYGISSNKLFDFMASARPVIFCCRSENNPIDAARAGMSVTPDNPVALADAMRTLASTPLVTRQEMGARGRAYVVANHSFAMLATSLKEVAEQLTAQA